MTENHKRTNNSQPQDDSQRFEAHMENMGEKQFQRQMTQASALLSAGNGKDAIPLLERCLDFRPDDVNVLMNLGGAYILAGRHRYAVPLLEKATGIAPNNPSVWSNLAAAYLGKLVTSTGSKQEKALEAYGRVIELDPAYPNVHYNMGLIYIDRREWDAAHDAFTRALETNADDQDARKMRARVEEVRTRPDNPRNN